MVETTKKVQSFLTMNTSPKNLRGEIWKDIPGFEDEYQLSNYGRLKSQDRWVNYKRCDSFRPGRIRKLLVNDTAKKANSLTVDLQMKLHKEGKRYYYSVARYTYCLFISPFDLKDHRLIVTRKDGNGFNCHYKNLLLRSISEVAKEGFATKKRRSLFQLQVKPVTQYSLEGKLIRQYQNTKEASEATGIAAGYINGAACTKHRTGGGYFWRYGQPKSYIRTAIYKKPVDQAHKRTIVEKASGIPLHHYLNRHTNSLSREIWKDIDGFEGKYQVSDHGRIRSLARPQKKTTQKGNTAYHWSRELIMKQNLKHSFNHYTGERLSSLTIALKKDGAYKAFVVARLVYEAFGSTKGELKTHKVIHKDEDNLNNHISNLALAAQSKIVKTSYQKGRRESYFATPASKKD